MALFYGLTNGGATCWLNATYQSLISLDPLMEVLLRHALAIEPARLMLANYINDRLTAKFFGFGQAQTAAAAQLDAATLSAIIAQASAPTRELFVRIVSIIDALSNSESFYAAPMLRELFGTSGHDGDRDCHDNWPFPLATCAIINYGRNQSIQVPDALADSALRLFGALVIYCAATGARPVPEYHSIGEVGPAMLETIIGALCWEQAGAEEIRAIFRVRSHSLCYCFDHADEFVASATKAELPKINQGPAQDQMCIQAVPPGGANDGQSFVASVQTSVDICEKYCMHTRANADSNLSQECGIPSVLNLEYHESFGPVLVIMTDDSIARGLTRPTVTSVYRRSPIGMLQVPREMSLMTRMSADAPGAPALATYHLVAQIIQEGGHFTATVARSNRSGARPYAYAYAYASDRSISPQSDMTVSPGVCALFYTRVRIDALPSDLQVTSIAARAICESIKNYVALNNNINVVASSGHAAQPLAPAQSIAAVAQSGSNISLPQSFRDFYFAAMNMHITLAIRTTLAPSGLETLWANKIGAHHGSLIARAVLRAKQAKFQPDIDFAIWRFCADPVVRAILRATESDKLRAEIDRRMSEQINPLVGLAAHNAIISHPSKNILIERINAYLPGAGASTCVSAAILAPAPAAAPMPAKPAIIGQAPLVISGAIRHLVEPNGVTSRAPPVHALGNMQFRRQNVIAVPSPTERKYQPQRPLYITPRLELAYEKFNCTR